MKDQPLESEGWKNTQPTFLLSEIGIEDRDLRLEMFTLCDGANEHAGRLSLLGTFDTVHASQVPFVMPQATLVLRIRFWPAEAREHTVRLVFMDPDGRPVASSEEMTVTLQPMCEERSAAYILILPFQNVRIEEYGEYSIDFYLNDKIEGRLPFVVGAPTAASVV